MVEKLFSITKREFEVDTFRSGGKGGQHQNKTDSGVRIRHIASGAVGESREHKSQHANKREALERLAVHPKLRAWIRIEAARRSGAIAEAEAEVDRQMQAKNIKTEVQDENGRWVEVSELAALEGDRSTDE
jgi:protein subunit release factor B